MKLKNIPPLSLAATLGMALLAAPPLTEIVIHADRPFPESVTSTSDGTIFVGALAAHMVFKAAPGAATAEPWLAPGVNGLQDVLGVLADEPAGILWVCSTNMSGQGAPTALAVIRSQDRRPEGQLSLSGRQVGLQ